MTQEKKIDQFKLRIDWKPSRYHGHTVRKNLKQRTWQKVRGKVLVDNNFTCSICGFSPESEEKMKLLHVHEIEEYSQDELLCILQGLDLICANCHSFYHFGRSVTHFNKTQMDNIKKHFMKVNNCSEIDFKDYYSQIAREKMKLSLKLKAENFKDKKFRGNSILIDTVLFRIEGDIPFKEEVIKELMDKGLYRYYENE
ncbi:hypothetical protein FZD47_21110 [Bacillus infantis]|uniref:HNH endonuclease n=1 Tax=Bacillus infantis TaxID=324767 RepID=A0A5D4SBR3_9BACI|nr:hypothetical protein [Bacillus infantis]TYS60710.1 hypothetical protein FZD47_21110 [Bacillus infantis]